jgi:FAD/FMN-containing dehydrogenase
MGATVDEHALQELRQTLKGPLHLEGDAGYDDARALFNAMIDVRPAVIAQCADVADVQAALAFARASGLPLAVRSGGHSVAGMSTVPDGLVIDVRPMNEVTVDAQARVARCGAGATWADVDRATQEHGLATTGGRVSTTGVAGLTLGGGSGWLERKLGLTCDTLVAVELVTAAGEPVRATATEHPDLFWALHGGGGNFGVVTTFEFALAPVGPEVLAGLMLWPEDAGRALLELTREVMADAPDDLATAVVYVTGPPEPFVPEHLQGTRCCALAFLWAGEQDAGQPFADHFRALDPAADLVGPMPYVQFQSLIDDPPGLRNYWTADYLTELTDEAIDTFVAHSSRLPVPSPSQSIMFAWGGAVARVSAADTPLARRDAPWVVHPFAVWEDAADDERFIGWARAMSADFKRFGLGVTYLNFIGDEGADRIRAAFGDSYERLERVKTTYDPDNVFRRNQNIAPATAAGVG